MAFLYLLEIANFIVLYLFFLWSCLHSLIVVIALSWPAQFSF